MRISTQLELLAKRRGQLTDVANRIKRLIYFGLGNNPGLHTRHNKLKYAELIIAGSLAFHLTSLVAEYKAMVWGVK